MGRSPFLCADLPKIRKAWITPDRLQLFSCPPPPRPPAKLMAAFRPGGGSAESATCAKPPVETPALRIVLVSTSGNFSAYLITVRKSVTLAWPASSKTTKPGAPPATRAVLLSARPAISRAHHNDGYKSAARKPQSLR